MTASRTVFVTGANSGIGLALALLLRRSHHRVIATCRSPSMEVARKAGLTDTETFRLIAMDVMRTEDRCAAIAYAEDLFGGVDVLINNAGISYRSMLEDMSDEDDQLQIGTNYLGPVALMRLTVPHMREQRWGRIINVSSVGGMMAMPTMGAYSASKFALEGASEAFWYEGRPWGISVTLVQPGFIRSESFRRVVYGSKALRRGVEVGPYAAVYKEMGTFIEKCMNRTWATPESIAQKILQLIDRKEVPLRMPVTFDAHLFSWMRRLLPRSVYHRLLYRTLPGIDTWGRESSSSEYP